MMLLIILSIVLALFLPVEALVPSHLAVRTKCISLHASKRSILRRSIEKKQQRDLDPEESAKLEWEALDRAAAEAGDAFQEALEARHVDGTLHQPKVALSDVPRDCPRGVVRVDVSRAFPVTEIS